MRVHNSILSISTVILLLLLGIMPAAGQNSLQMYVKGFDYDPTDLTASNPNYRKKDGNGDVYAIIKVKSDTPGDDLNAYNFNFGMMSSTKEVHGEELWLYVQKNAKTVTITRQGYATIQRYDLKIAIQPACTYILTLSSQKPTVQSSILQFKVSPPDEQATVKVKREGSSDDYQIWGTVDQNGSIDNMLEEGIYLYKIVADKYFDSEGRVELDGTKPVHVEPVTLKPNFGYLEVTGTEDISGAEIYVNDKKVGEIPYKLSEHWACGDYSIAIIDELYKTYSSTFTIRIGETTVIKPQLEPNFAEITIKTADKAEIWLDGKLSGTGLWKGRLKAGLHNVECRQTSHETSKQQIIVQQGKTETFNIDAPKPITGSLYISSTPSGADIVIDGARIGQVTPYLFNNILTGNHVVALSLTDYVQVSQNITITQGNTENIKFSLEKQTYNTTVSAQTALLDNNMNGKENGHDYVDLGLPSGIKWATCNVGASKPEDYGDYFAWGETTTKSTYNWSTYKYCNGSSTTMTKYCTSSSYGTVDNKTTLELSDDAARANWGGSWRMPTATEIDELLKNCTWELTTLNGVKGYKVTGKKAGYTDKSIFLPAAGCRSRGNLILAVLYGYYWSSSLNTGSSRSAYGLYFNSSNHRRYDDKRYYGQSVRPVCP